MSRTGKFHDPLLQKVEEVLEYARKEGFVVFYGWAQSDKATTVYWNEERGGDWRNFLACAKALGIKAVYLSWTPFEQFQVEEALTDATGDVLETQISEANRQEAEGYKQQVEQYRERVGLTAIVDLAFLAEGVFHGYQITADWFRAFEEVTAEEEEEHGETEEQKVEVDKTLVNKWASELANHPKFGSCKNDDQREYLLETLAGTECESLPLWHILRRAETLYLFEVRPKEDERFREKARELRKKGLNMNAIAQKLSISRDRVSGLLVG